MLALGLVFLAIFAASQTALIQKEHSLIPPYEGEFLELFFSFRILKSFTYSNAGTSPRVWELNCVISLG